MQIEKYISDLLYRYDCVTIPDFGAFLCHIISANIDEKNNFYPPKKQLSFNAQIQQNDGLLATYISKSENISFESAVAKIAAQADGIKRKLSKNEVVNLKFIGELSMSKEGLILFNPCYQKNYLTTAFGLSNFTGSVVDRAAEKTTILTNNTPSYGWIKIAGALILLFGLFNLVGSAYSTQVDKHNDLAQKEANRALDTRIQEATFVLDQPLPAVEFTVRKKTGDYFIVAGAFRVKSNSYKKLEQLHQSGYKNALRIGKNKTGLFQVAYGRYQTRKEAVNQLTEIRKKNNRSAWLLVKRGVE